MKIIATVGTSLITNSEVRCDSIKRKGIKEKPEPSLEKEILKKQEDLLAYLNSGDGTCAELASIDKIDPEGEADILFICTETMWSYLCGIVLQQFIGERAKVTFIKGLQIENIDIFNKEGVPNLLNEIEKNAQNGIYWDDIVLNVTGGYKALIPIMTVIGQIKNLPIYYIFKGDEDKKYQLIKIPQMPISFDTEVFEDYFDSFCLFGIEGNEITERSSLSSSFINNCEGFIEIAEDFVVLNPIAKILWWNYRQKYFLFKTDSSVWEEIQNQQDIKRILSTKFLNTELRESKTEKKQDHYVFDDGNNNNRIYYFLKNKEIFIYKTFENEEKAKAYIDTNFDTQIEKEFIQNSKMYRIKKS